MPRFVLLHHEWPGHGERPSHCDLMLESGGALRTWALAKLPRDWAGVAAGALAVADDNVVPAEALGDHRLAYLDYEGPVSGDRGAVRQLDRGECEILENRAEWCVADLSGAAICSTVELRRTDGRWQLALRP